jgi:hypothetical protein
MSHNIYYHLNKTTGNHGPKAKKSQVVLAEFVHVDIDPEEGQELESEQKRIADIVAKGIPGVPTPTFTVFSGGGYNLIWRLKEPVQIDGKPEIYEDFELYNKKLIELYKGDIACFNVDRILRVPGTINWPDERKLKRGRVPTETKLVLEKALDYPLSVFDKSTATTNVSNDNKAEQEVILSKEVPLIQESDFLPNFSASLKSLILTGRDPANPQKYKSRSEALFAVCRMLLNAEVSDDYVYGVITNPAFAISESVLDKKGGYKKYAIRQITRAKKDVDTPDLYEMNSEYFVLLNEKGQRRIGYFVYDSSVGCEYIKLQKQDDFIKSFMNKPPKVVYKNGEPCYVNMGQWWLTQRDCRVYEEIRFRPDIEGDFEEFTPSNGTSRRYLNKWLGFTVSPKKGDWTYFREFLRDVICSGNEENYNWLIKWMAHLVQKPGQITGAAVVLQGDKGTGKGTFANTIRSLFGEHAVEANSGDQVFGYFNGHLHNKVLVFMDVAIFAADPKVDSKLKTYITEENVAIRALYAEQKNPKNYLNFIIASNDQWVVPAHGDERRYFAVKVSNIHKKDHAYFGKIHKQMQEQEGLAAMLYDLLQIDITDFMPQKDMPKTEELTKQRVNSMSLTEHWLWNRLRDGVLTLKQDKWEDAVDINELYDNFLDATRGEYERPIAKMKLLPEIVRLIDQDITTEREGGMLMITFPPLDACRKGFDRVYGETEKWPEPLKIVGDKKSELF